MGPGQFEVSTRPETRSCKPGEALIEVAAVGVCATDVELFEGTMGYYEAGLASWPLVPGHEWSGRIAALGRDCPSDLAVGQRVVGEHATGCQALEAPVAADAKPKVALARIGCARCTQRGGFLRCPQRAETGFFRRSGALQTFMRFPAAQLHMLPDSVPWDLAALAEPLATALKAVRLAGLSAAPRPGQPALRAVVVGDGPVALLVLQALRWRQCQVACVVGANASRLRRASELGADSVWDISQRGTDELATSLEKTGELPSVVIEAAGTPSAVALSIKLAAPGGHVVLLGLSGNGVSGIRADDIVLKQLVVRGSLASEPEDWQVAAEMLSRGAVQSVVTHKLEGLDRYGEAIRLVKDPPCGMLKLQLLLGVDDDRDLEVATVADEGPNSKAARISE